MEEGITFTATFGKAMTTVDGSWRLSLDLSEDSGGYMAELSKLKGVLLQVAIIPIKE